MAPTLPRLGMTRASPSAHSEPGRRATSRLSGDALLGRGLRYGLLVLYAGTVFTLVVTAAGITGARTAPPWWLAGSGLILVAATLLPVDAWLRVRIDRLIFDWHDDPYAVLSEVRQHLDDEQARLPDAIIPAVAGSIATTLRLPYVAIETDPGDGAHTTSYGVAPPRAELLTIPLAYRGVAIGALHTAARRPGESLSADDRRLLGDLARQVGITLHAARLSDALQNSRAELVTAREEERRRIRRDLHDSLGPTLASLRMQLGAVRRALREQPEEAEALIDALRDDVRDATAAIRRLVYDLRPPLLDEHGLSGALRGLDAVAAPATLTLDLPETLPQLSAAVEVALYRIGSEAVHNVARHAQANSCIVRLRVDQDMIQLTVDDDGVGLRGNRDGIGLTSMRERAAELGGTLTVTTAPGGGTCVNACIPWRRIP